MKVVGTAYILGEPDRDGYIIPEGELAVKDGQIQVTRNFDPSDVLGSAVVTVVGNRVEVQANILTGVEIPLTGSFTIGGKCGRRGRHPKEERQVELTDIAVCEKDQHAQEQIESYRILEE